MALYNLSVASIELPVQPFIAICLCTHATEDLFIRSYCKYPEAALEQFSIDVSRAAPEMKSPRSGTYIRYLGKGELKIDLRSKWLGISDFISVEGFKFNRGFMEDIREAIGKEKGFEGFTTCWLKKT